jgi:hypothetical protein
VRVCIQSDISRNLTITDCEAEKRRQALQERRLEREKIIGDSLHVWEKEILPNWRVVYKNPELRKLWWRGIPSKLRAPLWESAVGNGLALSKGSLQLTDNHILLLIIYSFCSYLKIWRLRSLPLLLVPSQSCTDIWCLSPSYIGYD